MKTYRMLGIVAIMTMVMTSCVQRQERSRNADKYENWKASLADSVAVLEKRRTLAEDSLTNAYNTVDSLLKDFAYSENPREVEGYTILKSAKKSYPLSRTGLTARISKSEGFELVAVLSGNTFSSISVSDGSRSVRSAVVPHDQALNYRSGNLTTVLFTGAEADSIGMLLASGGPERFNVTYSGQSGKGIVVPVSATDVAVVSRTWQLAEARREVHRLEMTLPLISRKIDLLRQRMDK